MRSYKNYKGIKKESEKRAWGFAVSTVRKKIKEWPRHPALVQTQLDSTTNESVRKALDYFGVKKSAKPIIVAAGFTGNFARAVRAADRGKVIFTDMHEPWVTRAKKGVQISKTGEDKRVRPMKGFVMDMEKPHINDRKISAMISFEPTPLGEGFNKTVLPNLGSKNGFIIATGSEMFDYSAPNSWAAKTNLSLFKTYGVQARMIRLGDKKKITFMQFKIPEKRRKNYLFDRECYESIKHNGEPAGEVAKRLGVPEKRVMDAYLRYGALTRESKKNKQTPHFHPDYMDYDYKTVHS